MATKTFKIGLSNAEKQAMAQNVYERLLALTFPEYDTSTQYSVGDFVVYNDQLYKCIGATSGAWDSSKWQLATFNDLLTDIEDAVAFVNDKANVDGNYPTMTVGVADNLSPYDEEAGIKQSAPFNFQASGTNNGSDPLATVGELALLKEKRGNTVVVNQLINESARTTTYAGVTYTISLDNAGNTVVSLSGTANDLSYVSLGQQINNINGHKVLVLGCPSTGDATKYFLRNGHDYSHDDTGSGNISTVGQDGFILQIIVINGTNVDGVVFKPIAIDLTQWFNGDIPQDLLDHPEHFFRYYQGSLAYNEGTLVNSNGRYIKCIGRQQWDEETQQNYVYDTNNNGLKTANSNWICSQNLQKCIPNKDYYIFVKDKTGWRVDIVFFDSNGNLISYAYRASNSTFKTPDNCVSFALNIAKEEYESATYQNDITISLYYEDESSYDQYYPYEVLANNDTGTETLRSAGNVADIKLPSGEIKRNIGTYTFTGNETVYYNSEYDFFSIYNVAINGKSWTTNVSIAGYIKFVSFENDLGAQLEDDGTTLRLVNHSLNGDTNALLTSLIGKSFNYELAEPTTEQGTPFSENVEINDFGSMDFGGTSSVPQGNLIFYPVDYKAYLDTLHKYTDGDPDNLALKSDLVGLVPQQDLSSEITEVASGLTYVLKKAYKTGNVVNLSIDVENNTGSAINENTTLFAIGSDLLPIPNQLNIIGYYAGDVCRVQINKSGQVGNVSINKQFEFAGKLTFLVSYAVA